jgi:hypothetical protein
MSIVRFDLPHYFSVDKNIYKYLQEREKKNQFCGDKISFCELHMYIEFYKIAYKFDFCYFIYKITKVDVYYEMKFCCDFVPKVHFSSKSQNLVL